LKVTGGHIRYRNVNISETARDMISHKGQLLGNDMCVVE